ncbi:RTA1-domain-containing protein [Hyaloscypha variabilis F]|uniref:RTA1-domain-containing protein n=1 Tax=Hyaloscypha variabilis (strain UAMH 11265 / GT02V1 / F) TaxID=1149755 RepID=A0A2J6R6X1_HYAVF|nr:RTA1-domain-containing protein [Hyaloscypha variabilis F]
MPQPTYQTCTSVSPQCPVSATTYGYNPNLGGNVFFSSWFGLMLIASLFIGFRKRTWTYTLGLSLGCLGEMVGYIGRDLMSLNPWNGNAFKIQIVCLILAPSFVAASIYLTIKYLVLYFGAEYSILKARWYPWLFIGCDILSIVMQAIGGGVSAAATGGNNNNASLLSTGNNLMIAGIAFQVATMGLAGILFLTFAVRYRKGKHEHRSASDGSPEPKFEPSSEEKKHRRTVFLYCAIVAFAYLTVLARCIYRLPEMAGGWGNRLMQNETEFLILDGAMIAIATLCLTIVTPKFASVRSKTL